MAHETLAKLFYFELEKAVSNPEMHYRDRIQRLAQLLQLLFTEATRAERLRFSTLFARMAYAGHRYELPGKLQYYLHQFRKLSASGNWEEPVLLPLGTKALGHAMQAIFEVPPPESLEQWIPKEWPLPYRTPKRVAFQQKVRVVALSDDAKNCQLSGRAENMPEEGVVIAYNIAEHNENFNPTIEAIRKVFGFPVTLQLIDVDVDAEGVLRPRAIVVEPDYLMDVSAVAACFREGAQEPLLFLLDKFKPFLVSEHQLKGHIANFFLDELMTNPEGNFKEIFPKVFKLYPLAFCLLPDTTMREIFEKVQKHFVNIKQMVKSGFREHGILPENCFLEPSFYSETYGLQGRLDVFCYNPDDESRSAIVELKSGSPFMPNAYQISHDHFAQTLLYDLLIQSVYDGRVNPANYILYSALDQDQLRFAPRIRTQQYEALQVRNQLCAVDRLLANLGTPNGVDLRTQGQKLFKKLRPSHFPHLKGFIQRDLQEFERLFEAMTDLEQRYFTAFVGFIAREHQLNKTGIIGVDNINGLASLWLNSPEEKQEQFQMFRNLRLRTAQTHSDDPVIELERNAGEDDLANFRQGDLAVLYPAEDTEKGILGNQIFKCTLIEISPQTVKVRLRSRQFNDTLFKRFKTWNIEHDMLEVSYVSMYRALRDFAASPKNKKDLLLGLEPPRKGEASEIPLSPELTEEQQEILQKAIAAPDYFLLWGPPGTGKTSMMLKHLVGYLLEHTDENILLLAYTNRAVDEMCEAVEALGGNIRNQYFRIGSRYSTQPEFHRQLLDGLIQGTPTRQALKEFIQSRRIVLATVASIGGKPEILRLKNFQRVIIDEASQILEPLLAGLLPRFERFILIGDHKQLPAVVGQAPDISAVHDPALHSIGLYNLRNSFFERLFKLCVQNQYHWAFAQLSRQGRMHKDIMAFPNQYFYQNTLQILPDNVPTHIRQLQPPTVVPNNENSDFLRLLSQKRMVFLSTPVDEEGAARKTNKFEAERIAELVLAFRKIYSDKAMSIGIITPFRAQIARIRVALEAHEINPEELTIDTVERYQGGARDIILFSLCTNSLSNLSSLVSLSEEGVDRKLNVALTRAREHVVLVGNAELLKGHGVYEALVNEYAVDIGNSAV